jgi:hypothetical protein
MTAGSLLSLLKGYTQYSILRYSLDIAYMSGHWQHFACVTSRTSWPFDIMLYMVFGMLESRGGKKALFVCVLLEASFLVLVSKDTITKTSSHLNFV